MSRTARCLFALGLSVSLAAACGDDDGDDTTITAGTGGGGNGGTGGTAGRGGTGGTAGTAGLGGTSGGGSGGSAGTAGVAGTAGTAGTAGAAGTAGTAGTGGTGEEPDAGPDAEVSDAGLTCPGDTSTAETSAGNQEVIITSLVFNEDDDSVTVTFRAVSPGGFQFSDPLLLCTGSEPDDCDEGVQDVTDLAVGQEDSITTGLGLVTAASGEIALVNGLPSGLDGGDPSPFVRAYVNWGDYVSLDPENEAVPNLETRADDEFVWTAGESIDIGENTVVFATGDVTSAAGFEVCTPD